MIKKIKILNDYYFCNVNSVVYTLLYILLILDTGYKNQDQLIFLIYIFRYSISNYNDLLCIYFELGVSEFWQLFLTHMLSLESVLGFCHGIA